MISEICDFCASQVLRLSAKPYFAARGDDAPIELTRTLHTFGHARAREVIEEALIRRWGTNGEDAVPSPADLYDLCRMDVQDFRSFNGDRAVRKPSRDCSFCEGMGWEFVEKRGIECATRCRCTRSEELIGVNAA